MGISCEWRGNVSWLEWYQWVSHAPFTDLARSLSRFTRSSSGQSIYHLSSINACLVKKRNESVKVLIFLLRLSFLRYSLNLTSEKGVLRRYFWLGYVQTFKSMLCPRILLKRIWRQYLVFKKFPLSNLSNQT